MVRFDNEKAPTVAEAFINQITKTMKSVMNTKPL
jgi:hypothetical protein